MEKPSTYALALFGGLQGVFRYYVRPEITAKRTWALIGAVSLVHEIISPPGELLSEGVDLAMKRYPIVTRLGIGVTALHLANMLPPQIDPYHAINQLIRGSNEAPTHS